MKRKTVKYGSHSFVQVLIVLGILVFVNIIAVRLYGRLDLTEDSRYTLSDTSRKVLSGLDDVATFICYFSKDMPAQGARIRTETEDILAEYKAAGGGNLRIEVVEIDPNNQEAKSEARSAGIPELTMNIWKKDRMETVKVYLGMVIKFEDRQEAIPAITPAILNSLEYEITSALMKVSGPGVKTVGFWFGHQAAQPENAQTPLPETHSLDGDYKVVKNSLEKNYRLRTVDISGGKKVPSEVDTLVVAGASGVTEAESYEIDQFIMRGKNAVFLLDTFDRGMGLQAEPKPSGLAPMLRSYGADLLPRVVFDASCSMAAFRMGSGGFQYNFIKPYPFWPKVTESGIDRKVAPTRGLDSLIFPWTSPVEPYAPLAEGVEATKIISSSQQSWAPELSSSLSLHPENLEPPAEPPGRHTLVLGLRGRFKSYFAGKPLPQATDDKGQPLPDSDLIYKDRKTVPEDAGESNILVVGDSNFISAGFGGILPNLEDQSFTQNLAFFQNVVDWYTLGEGLIEIRSQGLKARPIKDLSEGAKSAVKFVNLFGIPLLIAAFGLTLALLRRREKRLFEESIQGGGGA